MTLPSGDLAVLLLKLALGTAAFVWVLWTVRNVNPRAVGMMLTFPALNGIVLLTVTDKLVSEVVVGILPLMFFNSLLPSIFIALRKRLAEGPAIAICLLLWGAVAAVLEWQVVWAYRRPVAEVAALLIFTCAGWAFWRLRRSSQPEPAPATHRETVAAFLRNRGARIFWFFVSFLVVSLVAYSFADAHSLVGRLSALPLVPLFVLHWAVVERRADLDELRVSALMGPVAALGFVALYAWTLGFIRTDGGALHPWYWPIGVVALLIEWELARRFIIGTVRLTYTPRVKG